MVPPIATVVIPNFNGMQFLPRLMASLEAQRDPRWTAIVVDDGSTDESVAYLRASWPRIRLLCNPHNLGFAGTCNVGMREAATPFVALLNNDTHLDADWLAQGLRPFDSPDVGAVASLVLLAEPPHRIDTAGDLYSVAGGAVKRGHMAPRAVANSLGEAVFSASGAAAFFRREAVESAGLLDERFDSYYEDVDLGFRLAWLGYRTVFAAKSVCYHHLSSSYSPRGWRYHFNSARNAELVWWSCLPRRLRRRYLPAHLLFLVLQAINKLRQGCLKPYLAGKWAAIRSRDVIRERRRAIQASARADETSIDARIEHDWWRLHVSSQCKGGAATEVGG
ncbi:MAG: glycosyltransferase family 2 protein [Planctomycetota bacterium]